MPRTALMFSNRHIATRGAVSLLVARSDNGVFEYELKAKPNENLKKSPELEITSSSTWALHRYAAAFLFESFPGPRITRTFPRPSSRAVLWFYSRSRGRCLPKLEKPTSLRLRSDRATGGSEVLFKIGTYSVPSRRLWQGPQFTFYQYSEDLTEIMPPPSDSKSAVASVKCIPIVMGDKSIDRDDSLGREPRLPEESLISGEAIRIECGSWVSQNSITMASPGDDADLSLKIAEAMKEARSDNAIRQVIWHQGSECNTFRTLLWMILHRILLEANAAATQGTMSFFTSMTYIKQCLLPFSLSKPLPCM